MVSQKQGMACSASSMNLHGSKRMDDCGTARTRTEWRRGYRSQVGKATSNDGSLVEEVDVDVTVCFKSPSQATTPPDLGECSVPYLSSLVRHFCFRCPQVPERLYFTRNQTDLRIQSESGQVLLFVNCAFAVSDGVFFLPAGAQFLLDCSGSRTHFDPPS